MATAQRLGPTDAPYAPNSSLEADVCLYGRLAMSRFGGGPSGLQLAPLALSSKINTLRRESNTILQKVKRIDELLFFLRYNFPKILYLLSPNEYYYYYY